MIKKVAIRIRTCYFEAIIKGEKTTEYRVDSEHWRKMFHWTPKSPEYFYKASFHTQPKVAVLVCGKRVHRRRIVTVRRIRTPTGFSDQGKKDVPTDYCFAISLGAEWKEGKEL